MFPPAHRNPAVSDKGPIRALCCFRAVTFFIHDSFQLPANHHHVSDKAKQIANLLSPTVQALGLELLGAEYLPAPGSATLRLYIDVIEAERDTRIVNIEDCEAVS